MKIASSLRALTRANLIALAIIFGLIASLLYVKFNKLSNPPVAVLTDFDIFHMVGSMILRGEGLDAYYSDIFRPMQEARTGSSGFLPWTYPPPYNLFVAVLALAPAGIANAFFISVTLSFFIAVLFALNGARAILLIVLFFPVFVVIIGAGQNGFLTAGLAGLACLQFIRRQASAGIPLGLLVIKPHLGLTLGVFAIAQRASAAAVIVSAATIVALFSLSTYVLGASIWSGFLHAIVEAKETLIRGEYQLHRMVSPYAAARTVGASSSVAMAVQLSVACGSILAVYSCARNSEMTRQALGLAAASAVLISPYVYDYDLLIYCVGLGLLLPEVDRIGRPLEKFLLYALSFSAGAMGLLQSRWRAFALDDTLSTLSGFALVICFAILWRIVSAGSRVRLVNTRES